MKTLLNVEANIIKVNSVYFIETDYKNYLYTGRIMIPFSGDFKDLLRLTNSRFGVVKGRHVVGDYFKMCLGT